MKSRLLVAWLICAVACGGGGGSGASRDDGALVVMTRNLYVGAALEPLLQTFDPITLPAAVGATFRTIEASDPAGRMERVAEEIAAARADVVGLQEVALLQTRSSFLAGRVTAHDFLELLLAALDARGERYLAVATSTNADAELPDDAGRLIRLVDRDVVLVREGVRVSEVASGRFAARVGVTVGEITAEIPRGWVSARVEAEGLDLRVVNTHLEIEGFRAIQEAQARELAALMGSDSQVVLTGDLNSAADGSTTASYAIVRAAGLEDAWPTLRPGEAGFTCCFAPDLRDPAVPLATRIDVVLRRGTPAASAVDRVGASAASRTATGVQPSDHAGVVATFPAR
jgi:endonuclease/exonuclease/phosphatase family metal-dependent hydrolase